MRKPESGSPVLRSPGVRGIHLPVLRRSGLLTVLTVILLAALFCLILSGSAKAQESIEESPDAAGVVSGDMPISLGSVQPFSEDSVEVLSGDVSPASEDLTSPDVLSPDQSLPLEVISDDLLSTDIPSEDAVPAEPFTESGDLSFGDAILRDMLDPGALSPDVVSGDVLSEDLAGQGPVSADGEAEAVSHGEERPASADLTSEEGVGSVSAESETPAPVSGDKSQTSPRVAAITGNRVSFRSDPSVSGKVLGMLDKGEEVNVLKEWAPPSKGEGVLARPCEIDIGEETIRLPNGFGVRITAVDESAGTATVSFRHGDGWVSGTLARDAVSSTKGDPWFLVQRQDGTLGWAYGSYLERDLRKPDPPGPEVQALYRDGMELLRAGKNGEALFCLDQALELYPAHVDALFARGRCLAAMKRYEEAVESFWEIAFYAPSHPRYLAWTGYCWQAVGLYEKAMLAYGAALRLHPDHDIAGPVADHLAQCRQALGLPGDASLPDDKIRAFVFDRWNDHIAGDIWDRSRRGEGLWETW